MRALLAALWQGDTAFPSGGVAFSNGVEGAAALAGRLDRAALAALLRATLRHRWASSERVAVLHAFHAADLARLAAIDAACEAATLAEPVRVGSRRNGRAFLTAHARLGTGGAGALRDAIATGACLGHLPVAQGWIWRRCGLDAEAAAAVSAFTSAAAMTNAAVRLGALGAIEAQGVLSDCLPLMAELAAAPFDPADPIRFASTTPWLDVAAVRHGRSDLRLFAN